MCGEEVYVHPVAHGLHCPRCNGTLWEHHPGQKPIYTDEEVSEWNLTEEDEFIKPKRGRHPKVRDSSPAD